uniref:(northern house mosquito) hypothetical protein n=1 Tax=Culex pipiens TaxID=7175 RepID=A0A8D8E132_CULPI
MTSEVAGVDVGGHGQWLTMVAAVWPGGRRGGEDRRRVNWCCEEAAGTGAGSLTKHHRIEPPRERAKAVAQAAVIRTGCVICLLRGSLCLKGSRGPIASLPGGNAQPGPWKARNERRVVANRLNRKLITLPPTDDDHQPKPQPAVAAEAKK